MAIKNKIVLKTIGFFSAGKFPWNHNEIVTVLRQEPDGDRVLAQDSRGNQQIIPKTYLTLLPPNVRLVTF